MKKSFQCRSRLRGLGWILVLWAGTLLAAWNQELMDAVKVVASGKYGAKEVSVLLRYNKEMQQMAYHGVISNAAFQKAQRVYVNESVAVLEQAVRNVNAETGKSLSLSLQKAPEGKLFEPFADIDAISSATKPDEIRMLLDETDRLLKEKIRSGGVKVEEGVFLPKANDVDVMADPRRTTEENFRQIADLNNMAYQSREAAVYEAAKRNGELVDLYTTGSYIDEMSESVKVMNEQIGELQREYSQLKKHPAAGVVDSPAYTRLKELEAEIGGRKGKQAKYIDRMNEATDWVIAQHGLEESGGMKAGSSRQAELGKSRWGSNASQQNLSSKYSREMVEEAYRRHADVMMALAKQRPEQAAECAAALERMKGSLNPKHLDSLKKQIALVENREVRELLGSAVATSQEEVLELVSRRVPRTAMQATASLKESDAAVRRALAEGDFAKAARELEILESDLAYARKYLGVQGPTPPKLDGLMQGYRNAVKESGRFPGAVARQEYVQRKMADLMRDPEMSRTVKGFVEESRLQGDLMRRLAREDDPLKRSMMREMLNPSSSGMKNLMGELRSLMSSLPVDTLLNGVFAGLDAYESYVRSGEGDADGAARKLLEAIQGYYTGMPAGLMMAITNMIIDAAKDAGYQMAVNRQDLEDFIAGIVSVSGWQNARSMGRPTETSVAALARRHATSESLRAALKKMIEDAAAGSTDTAEVKKKKSEALEAHLWPQLQAAWIGMRKQFVGEFQDAWGRFLEAYSRLQFEVEGAPNPLPLVRELATDRVYGKLGLKVTAGGEVAELRRALEDLRQQLYHLGGERHQMSLSVNVKVEVTHPESGAVMEAAHTDMEAVLFEDALAFTRPGRHRIPVRIVLKVVPLSTVTEASVDRETTYSLLRMIGRPDYDPRTEKWEWIPGGDYKEVKVTRNNVAGEVLAENQREFEFQTAYEVTVKASDLTDEVTLRIEGDRVVLAGQPAFFEVAVETASPTPPLLRYDWRGVDRVLTSDGSAGIKGAYSADAVGAMLTPSKPGRYEIELDAVREDVKGGFEKLRVNPLTLEVLDRTKLTLGLKVEGPPGAQVVTGHDAKLKARWFTIPYSLQVERLLARRRLFFAWHSGGELLGTGPDITLMALDAGGRVIDVLLYEEDERGKEILLAQGRYRLEVLQDPDSAPYEPEPWAGEPEAETPESGSAGAAGGASGGSAGPAAVEGDGEDTHHTANFGETLTLDFGERLRREAAGIEAADQDFFERQKQARKPGRDGDLPGEIRMPGEIYDPPPIVIPEEGISVGIVAGDGIDTVAEPDLPPGMEEGGNRGASVHVGKADDTEDLDGPAAPAVEARSVYCPKCGGTEFGPYARPPGAPDHVKDRQCLSCGRWGGVYGTPPAKAPAPAAEKRSGLRFIFYSSPTLEFTPPESADGRTKVTLSRVGRVEIWAEAYVTRLDLQGNAEEEKVELPKRIYEVKAPAFQIVTTPGEGGKVGEEVKARVLASPQVPAALVNYVWFDPVKRMVYDENSSSIGFEPQSADPVPLRVEAREPFYGTVLGVAELTYLPSAYEVEAEVMPRKGPRPQVWDPGKRRLVDAPRKAWAVHEEIEIKAKLKGKPEPKEVRWAWALNPGTTQRSSGISDSVRVSRSETGTVTAVVTARDGEGRELGSATVSVPVSISDREMRPPPEPLTVRIETPARSTFTRKTLELRAETNGGKAPYAVRWQGRGLSGTYGPLTRFTAVEPGTYTVQVSVKDGLGGEAEASVEIQVEATEKELQLEAFQRLVNEGYDLEKKQDLPGAVERYSRALTIMEHADVRARLKRLEDWLERQRAYRDLIAEAEALERAGSLEAAVEKYEASQQILGEERVRNKITELKNQLLQIRRGALTDRARGLAGEEKWEEAVAVMREAQKLKWDQEDEHQIGRWIGLAREQAAEAARKKQAGDLLNQGYAREKREDWETAKAKYVEADRLTPDDKIKERIGLMDLRIREQQAREQALAEEARRQREQEAARIVAEKAAAEKEAARIAAEKAAAEKEAARVAAEQAAADRKAAAQRLIAQGYQKEKAADWAGALKDYQRAAEIMPDPRLEERIALVKKRLAEENLAKGSDPGGGRGGASGAPGGGGTSDGHQSGTQVEAGWVLVDRKVVKGQPPKAVEGGEVRAVVGENVVELLLAKPYGIGVYASHDTKNPQRLHAKYSWTVPQSVPAEGRLTVPVTQRVLSNQTGKWANNFGVVVRVSPASDLTGRAGNGAQVKPYAFGIGNARPDWMGRDVTVTYEKEQVWQTGKPGERQMLMVGVQGLGFHKVEYTYEWRGGATATPQAAKPTKTPAAPSLAGTFEFRTVEGSLTARVEAVGRDAYRVHVTMSDPEGRSDTSTMRATGKGRILTVYPEEGAPQKMEMSADGKSVWMHSEPQVIFKRIR